jgi:hypothetical protein
LSQSCKSCKHTFEQKPIEKRKWTAEQIQEAKNLIVMEMLHYWKYAFKFYHADDKSIVCSIGDWNPRTEPFWIKKQAVARCNPGDEYNDYVGMLVSLLKVLNEYEKAPTWIKGDGK